MGMDMAECMKPHMWLHKLVGLGLGFLIVGLVPTAFDAYKWMIIGVVLIIIGIAAHYVIKT